LPHGETDWNKKEVFFDLAVHRDTTNYCFDGCRIDDIMLFGTEDGQIWGSWDGLRWVKVQDFGDSASIFRFTRRRPIYFIEKTAGKVYRLDITKEDLIRLFYSKYNAERGSVSNAETYISEQRVWNSSNYVDLTSVALSNVEASIKGLSRRNYELRQDKIANAGWEWGNVTGWYPRSGVGTYGTYEVTSSESANGTYSLKYTKISTDSLDGRVYAYNFDNSTYQTTSMVKGDVLIASAYIKGNVSSANRVYFYFVNGTSGMNLKSTDFNLTTSWTRISTYYVCTIDSVTIKTSWYFIKGISYITYFDSVLLQKLEVGIAYENGDTEEAIHYIEKYSPFTFHASDIHTANVTLTINGQNVSHSGTLTNGTESSATNLTGIFIGAVQVSANISGSGQCILKINGTRLLYEDSVILKGRTNSIYHGRYYGTFSPTVNTTEFIVVTNLATNITSVSYGSNKLTLIITSLSGMTTTSKVYCGSKGEPVTVSGATTWSYSNATKVCTISGVGTYQINVFWQPSGVYTTEVIVGTVVVVSTGVLVAWWYRRKKKSRTVSVP